jgi:L-ascorbate metabolism protein UlaG (beta-lactamase superfamily)
LNKILQVLILSSGFICLTPSYPAELVGERLTWAGVKLTTVDTTVFIDAVGTDIWDGKAPQGLTAVSSDTRRRYALITHIHNDHFDVDTLKVVLGERGYVICHEDIAVYVASRGLRVIPAKSWVPVTRGEFRFTAVPADDGLGESQVSWIVDYKGTKVFHAGDTLWHGLLGEIGKQYGPIDVAFLPINGARILRDPMPESEAVLTPQQAVDTALLLGAASVVPIHYGLDDPPNYVEVTQPLQSFTRLAKIKGIQVQALLPGDFVMWPRGSAAQ